MDSTSTVVKEDLTNLEPSQGNTPVVAPEEVTPPAPGDKTDPNLLLKSLHEEREKRRLAEQRAKELEEINSSVLSEEQVPSDEGKVLKKLIDDQNAKIARLEDERELEKVYVQFPDLKGLASEFDSYRSEFPRHKLENVAKLFMAEKGLIESTRKGLEKPTGGTRQPIATGMTIEEVKHLRETNHRQYQEMLRKGLIKV